MYSIGCNIARGLMLCVYVSVCCGMVHGVYDCIQPATTQSQDVKDYIYLSGKDNKKCFSICRLWINQKHIQALQSYIILL